MQEMINKCTQYVQVRHHTVKDINKDMDRKTTDLKYSEITKVKLVPSLKERQNYWLIQMDLVNDYNEILKEM